MGGNPIRLNAPQQGVKTEQYVQPGAGENQPVQVQLGNDVHNLSPVEPNPQQANPVVVPPLFSERLEANALNVARQNLGLPQEPPGQPQSLDERKVAPGDPQRQGEHLHFDVGKGFCANGAVQTGVGDFEVIEADPVEEPANLAKGEAKVVATDFEAIKALLASGKRGAGQFSVNRQTHALTTVNDNVLSFLNPKSNPLMSGLVSTPAENKSIRKVVRDALLGEVTKLREEIVMQKTAVTGNDPASQRVRDAFDALLGHLAATADGIKKSIVPPEASKQTAALDKAGVQALADELAEIGKALQTPPDVKSVADYKQALDEYGKTLDGYQSVLDANKRNLETNKANQTKNEQALAGYEKTCAEMISTAKADYERNCAEERASRRKTAADGHRAEHDGKVKEYNAFVKSREDGMKAHLSDLKAKYGTDKFDSLDHLRKNVFSQEPSSNWFNNFIQVNKQGNLQYYGYFYYRSYAEDGNFNKAARQQLQASLAHALWEAGLENDEYGQGLIAELGGDSLEKALDYKANYNTVKAVFDLIDQDGKRAPGEYKPLTEEELSAQVQYDPPPFDPASVQLPPKPQLLDTAELNELPPLGKLPPEPVLGQKPAGNGVDSLLGELALAKQEQKLSGLRERIPELKTRQTALAQEGLLLQENLLRKKYGVKSFQPVFKLIQEKDCFRDAGTRGWSSVRLLGEEGMLTYQSESRLNLKYTQMSEAQNKTIRNQLMASLERETWRAGLADSKRMQTFLAHAAKTLQLGNPEAMGQKLDYVDAFELLHEFQMSVAAENPAFVAAEVADSASNKPVKNQGAAVAEAPKAGAAANVQPGEVRPAGVPSSLGSLGLSYAQFGGQLLNPLVEHLFDGMGVSLSGISLSGDKDGLKLEIKTFDASDMGVVANDGLLAKYENVTIPIKAKWNDGRLSFELGKLGCADPAKAERLNTLVKIARESGVLGGLEMPKGMSVESGNALGVVCDFRQMDVAMLADMGFGSNLAETIGGVRFSEKGVMVDFGKADNPLKLPQLDEKSGAMDIHLNVSTILNRCQGFLTRMMRDGMGVEVGEIGVSTTADGIVKFSLKNAMVLEGGWLRRFDLAFIKNLELEIRPTLNAETGLLEISLENLNVQTGGGFGGMLVGFASRFADYALSWAVSYAPNMVCQKERGNAKAKVSLALPNLMPEQFAFLGTQTLTKFAVSEKGIAIGIGMEPKPIRFAKPQPVAPVAPKAPEAPVAPEAPAKPVVPPPAGDLKRLGHLGTVGVSYKSFTDEILRPLMAQVAMDLGIDVRGLSLSGSSGGLRLNLSRLDLQGMLAKLGDSSSPTVRGLLKAFKWQKFDNVSIPISAQWNAQAGKLEFALGEIEGTSADGATLNRLVQDLRASGLLRALPASGVMAVVDEANQPLKLSFDLSSASVKELKSMGFNERLMDNVGDIRFRPEGVSLDIGAPRPRGAEVESPGVANSALNAEVDIGAIVANNQERIKNKLQDLGIRVQNVRVRTAASDGTLTVDLDQTNFDGLMDSWKSYGWYYKLAKPFLRTPGMSIKLRPSFDPATGKTTLAIVDFSVKGVLGPLTAFIGKRLVGPSWLSAMAPNLLSNEKAGKGELVRVAFTSSNLLPSALAGFGSQKISGLKVTNRGLAVGVGTNWRTELLKDNQATQQSIQLQFARTRQRIAELLRNPEFIDRYGSVLRYLTALAGILDRGVPTNFLRERCEDIRNARLEHAEEIRQGWRQIQELVKNENFRRRFNADDVTAASFPDVEDLAAALFTTLREE